MTYADSDVVKQRSGVAASDIANVSSTSEFNDLIDSLNDRAKSLIDEHCQRDFEEHADETTKVDGNGRRELSLPQYASGDGLYYPIISISSLKLNDNAVDASDYRIKPQANALNNRNAGIIERKAGRWPEGWENIEVTLTWGYSNPPPEIKSIAEQLIIDQLLNASQNDSSDGAESISMDGFSVSFSKRMRLSDEHKERLKRFRRVIV